MNKEENRKLLEDTLKDIYKETTEKLFKVLDIFNGFFGEANVDLQEIPIEDQFCGIIMIQRVSDYITLEDLGIDQSEFDEFRDDSIIHTPDKYAKKVITALGLDHNKRTLITTYLEPNQPFILVHFPHVKVTNENERSIDINHLYAKIKVNLDGTMNGVFGLSRSEYTVLQFTSDYMHSHISHIPTDDFTKFIRPCTGSGPINGTMTSLNRDYDEDLWNLFCLELSKYVTVESVLGVPYHYLEKLGISRSNSSEDQRLFQPHLNPCCGIDSRININSFIKRLIKSRKLVFNYSNGSYSIGLSYTEFIIMISNEFIHWYNEEYNKPNADLPSYDSLLSDGLIKKCKIKDDRIYYRVNADRLDYTRYIGKYICTFKGEPVTLTISDIPDLNENDNYSIILNPSLALYILTNILKVINYEYKGNSKKSYSNAKIRII